MESKYDIQKILELLPHRYPFILIDRILELVPDKRIVALKNVTINEPFFQGHFPAFAVMPGVLVIEAMAQAGGVLYLDSQPEEKRGSRVYFMGMDKVKFRKPVVPGDQIIFEVDLLKQRLGAIKMAGKARVGDKVVAEAELMATFGE